MSGRRRPPAGQGAGAGIFLAGVCGLLAGGALTITLASAVAGVLAGSGPVTVGFGEAASVLTALPAHLDDPAAAWPAAVRDELPGRETIIAAVIGTMLGLVLLVAALTRLFMRLVGRDRGRRSPDRAAKWAGTKDLRALRVRGPERGRVILGRSGSGLLAAEPRASVMVVAPSQSGKTTGLAIPAILEWDGPVLATSIKGDLAHDTIAARSRVGDVQIFDPTQSTGLGTSSWSPVAAASSWESARRTAARLLEIGQRGGAGSSADETFWRPAAARYLAPLLLAASRERATMGDVLSWIATGDQEEPREALEAGDADSFQVALDELESVWGSEPRYRTSVQQTTLTALDAWREPRIAAATCAGSTITASRLLDASNTLYLSAPAQDQRRLRGLFTALIADVIAEAFARSQATGKPIDPPLLLCLDEAANVAPLPNLDEIASTAPGQGVQLLSVFQNMSQIADRWGRDRAETIVANHRGRLFGSGIADRTTLEYLGAVLGEEEVRRVSTHKQRLELLELGSRTTSHDFKRLAAPNRVREADADSALLVYGRLPPTWLKLRPWYRDRRLRAQVAPKPAPRARALAASESSA